MFSGVEAAFPVGIDDVFRGGLLGEHQPPGYTALDVRHTRKVAVKRQSILTGLDAFDDFFHVLRRRPHSAGVLPSLSRPGQPFTPGINEGEVFIAGVPGAAVPGMLEAGGQHHQAGALHQREGGPGPPGHRRAVAGGGAGAEGVIASQLGVQQV